MSKTISDLRRDIGVARQQVGLARRLGDADEIADAEEGEQAAWLAYDDATAQAGAA